MNQEKIKEVTEHLEGLSYYDWEKVKMEVDTQFRRQKNKYERQLILDSTDDIYNAIQSRFG